jgi:hypothetical protein
MLVYRIENDNEIGPYTSGYAYIPEYAPGVHPSPPEDGLGRIEDHEYCAFESLEKAREWFGYPGVVEALEGFSLVVREVADNLVRFGRKQVVFPLKDSETIETHALDILLEVM